MTEKKSQSLGSSVELPEGAQVVRPDGSSMTVTGGSYVLDVPGVHTVDGHEITAR